MLNTLTQNPVPTVLIGLGLYWLFKDGAEPSHETTRRHRSDHNSWGNSEIEFQPSVGEQVTEKIRTAKDTVQGQVSEWQDEASHQAHELKEEASRRAKEWKEGAGQKMEEVKGYLQEQGAVVRGEFNHLLDNNPLAVGAVMVALGTVVAAAIPASRKEDQLMGDSRDRVMKAVKSSVVSTVDDVKHKAGQVAEKVLPEGTRNLL
ncbi:hypothetical protein [Candidatus Nitrospira allomarina]|uniref:Uncharacterized protein n=1 Tax=Candidatus Nitrospira allomarina TaxID=3020900 RepID=A0AA96JV73_9BACT|nr:hypothetical protein [Candidatus Nitrospira allomarina]WNM56596.1 hypothetical protein PP769_11465 [Candidatus Nitrospira allomarina]